MNNVLFDRNTLRVVGLNRPALPFEVEIKDVEIPVGFTKDVSFEIVTPQPDKEERVWVPIQTEEDGGDAVTSGDWVTVMVPQPPLVETFGRVATYEESPEDFTYHDFIKLKEQQVTAGTFYKSARLFEEMEPELFSLSLSSFRADLGFGFISLPSGGQVRTEKLTLPMPSSMVGLKVEASGEVDVRVGQKASELLPLDRFNEIQFDEDVSEVYVEFKNHSDKRIDIHSFALLV